VVDSTPFRRLHDLLGVAFGGTMIDHRPRGYRIARERGLAMMADDLPRTMEPVLVREAVTVLADVVEQFRSDGVGPAVHRLSGGTIAASDLRLSTMLGHGIMLTAAEFLDLQHGTRSLPNIGVLPDATDLRVQVSMLASPTDRFLYFLVATTRPVLEETWAALPDVERYPVPDLLEPAPAGESADEAAERAGVWRQLLALEPLRHLPLAYRRVPEVFFDLADSIAHPERYVDGGDATVTAAAVLSELERRSGPLSASDRAELLRLGRVAGEDTGPDPAGPTPSGTSESDTGASGTGRTLTAARRETR
jgi:hypothetical protein